MTGILFVTGGDAYARRIYAEEGRAYWTAALPVVLEKHGFTDFDVVDAAEAFSRSWDGYAGVLVGELGPESWTEDAFARVRSSPAPVLVEAALPGELCAALRIDDEGDYDGTARVTVADATLDDASRRYGRVSGGYYVGEPAIRPTGGTEPQLDWFANPAIGISNRRALAWAKRSWSFRRWSKAAAADVLAVWSPEGDAETTWPALVRGGNLLASCFGLFSYLGRAHTSTPRAPDRTVSFHRTTGLETLLLAVIDLMYRERGRVRARIAPWPHGIQWVRSVRHDFDRPVTVDYLRRVLSEHTRVGSAATWYWRAEPRGRAPRVRQDPSMLTQAAVVAEQVRHEVGIHTELLHVGAAGEREVVEYAIGRRVRGSCAHGANNCFRYQGAPNVLWAERQGLDYTELLEQYHLHPHRFAELDEQGRIRFLRVLCLPHHVSFDVSDGETYEDNVRRVLPDWIAVGGFIQVMNHPDINLEALMGFLGSNPTEGRGDWTAGETADWWRRTHVRDELTVRTEKDGTARARAESDVRGLVIELLRPDGSEAAITVDLARGETVELRADEGS